MDSKELNRLKVVFAEQLGVDLAPISKSKKRKYQVSAICDYIR